MLLRRAIIGRLFLIYIAAKSMSGYRKSSILLARIIKRVILVEVHYKRSATSSNFKVKFSVDLIIVPL